MTKRVTLDAARAERIFELLPEKVKRALSRNGVNPNQFIRMTEYELIQLRGIGPRMVVLIKQALEGYVQQPPKKQAKAEKQLEVLIETVNELIVTAKQAKGELKQLQDKVVTAQALCERTIDNITGIVAATLRVAKLQ